MTIFDAHGGPAIRQELPGGVNLLALVRSGEQCVYLYRDDQAEAMLQVLGRHADDPELSLTWLDAALLSQAVRRRCAEAGR